MKTNILKSNNPSKMFNLIDRDDGKKKQTLATTPSMAPV